MALTVPNDLVERVRTTTGSDTITRIFAEAMARTLRDAFVHVEGEDVFVLTGDIPAMWLRDSAAQVRPYLPLAADDDALADLLVSLVRRQVRAVLLDPYANAFNASPNGAGHVDDDTQMHPSVWERKYEIDSLAFPLQLAHLLWRATGRTDHLDSEFTRAAELIITTWRVEQDHADRSPYRFQRHDGPPSDTLTHEGMGAPVGRTGMSWSAFRPSDDACELHYNVPGNLFAAAALGDLATLAQTVLDDPKLAARARELAAEITVGVNEWGVVEHPVHGRIYAYEVDGLGHAVLMDDANMPSLLSLPLTGGHALDDELYLRTRAFVLSADNPSHVSGADVTGMGSPHTPQGYVWPIAFAVEGLTTTDEADKRRILDLLARTHAGTFRMHESFDVDDPGTFTREWFSWADSMFCELVLDVCGISVRSITSEPEQVPMP
ncbi:glycoside hydrolase family 125 protein [Pseudactinotalea terrae]|uniref:glycoside hydrolase family 125 protein n=1 Tax=Pseudactinotalea terrae TaxID=1743262 RepID=UPI001F4F910A|nr:glycoside hydrolase family 125 protein [Pseudactinotalea terrae]